METKVCNKCGAAKPLTEFYVYRRTPNGKSYLQSNCKECANTLSKEHHEIKYMKQKLRDRIKLILKNDFVNSKKEYVDIATGQKERAEKF